MLGLVERRDVPLAGHVGLVAGGLEDLGEGDAAAVEVAGVARGMDLRIDHVADAGLVRVEAGEQRRAAGAAAGGVVEMGEAHAFFGEGVEVGRADFAAEAADIGVAEIVGEEDDDVRGRLVCGGGEPGAAEGGEEVSAIHSGA